MKKYIKMDAIHKKLSQAEREHRILYIRGVIGVGKTAAVTAYYHKKPHIILSGIDGKLVGKPEIEAIKGKTLIIDDLSFLREQEDKDYIISCIKSNIPMVLISRSVVPIWLIDVQFEENFVMATGYDMMFDRQNLIVMYENLGIQPSVGEIDTIMEKTGGWPLLVEYISRALENGETCNEDLFREMTLFAYHYLDKGVLRRWSPECRDAVVKLSVLNCIDAEVTKVICETDNPEGLLDRIFAQGSGMILVSQRSFRLSGFFKECLQHKFFTEYTEEERKAFYLKLADFYLEKKNMEESIRFFRKAGAQKKVEEILCENARRHPTDGFYYSLRRYYYEIPEQVVYTNPDLIAGISLLDSLMLKIEHSEEMYQRLQTYIDETTDPEEKRNGKLAIARLRITLAHRGVQNKIKLIKDAVALMRAGELDYSNISASSRLPSLMNGGLDFSDWSKNDKALAKMLGASIEKILGKNGKGIVNIALAESGLEKGSVDGYEVLKLVSKGYVVAQAEGTVDLCFAAVGVMVRQYVFLNQVEKAWKELFEFEGRICDYDRKRLERNMGAMKAWLHLLKGDLVKPKEWIEKNHDFIQEFCTLFRYQYLMEIRVYLASNQNVEALTLLEKMDYYTKLYERHILRIQILNLKAILVFYKHTKSDEREWKEPLREALEIAKKYHFVHVTAEEGSTICPLLEELRKELILSKIKKDGELLAFLEEIQIEAKQMGDFYPNYLKLSLPRKETLTTRELEILRELCKGTSTEEICEKLSITYAGLKFHNRNIYKKLGVKKRREAEEVAKTQGLLV